MNDRTFYNLTAVGAAVIFLGVIVPKQPEPTRQEIASADAKVADIQHKYLENVATYKVAIDMYENTPRYQIEAGFYKKCYDLGTDWVAAAAKQPGEHWRLEAVARNQRARCAQFK